MKLLCFVNQHSAEPSKIGHYHRKLPAIDPNENRVNMQGGHGFGIKIIYGCKPTS